MFSLFPPLAVVLENSRDFWSSNPIQSFALCFLHLASSTSFVRHFTHFKSILFKVCCWYYMRQHPWALEFAWHENSKTFARHSISKTTTLEMWGLKQRPVDWRIKGKSTIVKQWTPSTKWGKTVGLRGHFWFQRYVTVLTLLNYGLALVLNALQNRASRKLISLKPLLAKTVSEKLIFLKTNQNIADIFHSKVFPPQQKVAYKE